MRKFVLLDANVTAGYYLPRAQRSIRAAGRIANILDSKRTGGSDHFFYIPNFCIAETFSVFMKHAFGSWNQHLRSKGTIDTRVYKSLVKQFEKDIHNGVFLYQYELARYHVLAINLIAPIDHHFQYFRKKRNHRPMGTFDHLVIAMGVHLAHVHGSENVAIASSDDRMMNIVARCRSGLPASTQEKLQLSIAERVTGRSFSPDLFPVPLNLKSARKQELAAFFGEWPLPVIGRPSAYRWLKS